MTISETITALKVAENALKEAEYHVKSCEQTVSEIASSVPNFFKDILDDFDHFCNNESLIIEEDFENVRDPDEVKEDIQRAVFMAGERDQSGSFVQESIARCNAYLQVRQTWMLEIHMERTDEICRELF